MVRRVTHFLPTALRDRLTSSALLQKLIANTGWLFADQVLRMGVGIFVSVWVLRYLGPEQFGLYSYLLAIVALLTPLATLGLDNIVVRELVSDPTATRRVLGTAFLLKLVAGAVAFLLAIGVITVFHPDAPEERPLIAIIAAGILFQALDVCDTWFRAQTMARYVVYARSAAFISCSLLRIGLILMQAPLIAFLSVALLELALGAAGAAFAFWRKAMPLTAWELHLDTGRRLLAAGWPLMLAGLAVTVYVKIDIVMLNAMRGSAAAGIYAAAVRLSEVWYFIPMTIVSSVTPTIIAARQADLALYYRRLEQMTAVLVLLSLALVLPITVFAYPVVTLIFGAAYQEAAPVLAIHIWSAVFVFLGVAQSPWDLAEDLTRLALLRTAGGAVINIALNLILIPLSGTLGAALATAVSYACSGWLLNAFHPRSRRFFLLQTRAMIPFGWRFFRSPQP